MDIFDSCHYRQTRCFMSFIAQWPYDNSFVKSVQRFIISAFICSFIQVQIFKIFTSEKSMDMWIELVPQLLFFTLSFVKYVCYWYNGKIIKRALDCIKCDWAAILNDDEINILKKSIEEANFYGFLAFCASYTGLGLFLSFQMMPSILDMIVPLNESRARSHLLIAEYFVDSEKYYYPILVHMQISTVMALTVIIATDKMAFAILLHACGMYNIIGYRLEHLFDLFRNSTNRCNNNRIFLKKMVCLVNYHRHVIEYVEIAESFLVGNFYIVQLILAILILTSLLLQLNKILTNAENRGMIILVVLVRLIASFLVSFLTILPAQRVADCSEDMYRKAYYGSWYTAPVQAQKLFLFLMKKMAKPYIITIENVLEISVELYASIVRTALSYFTAIQAMQ